MYRFSSAEKISEFTTVVGRLLINVLKSKIDSWEHQKDNKI